MDYLVSATPCLPINVGSPVAIVLVALVSLPSERRSATPSIAGPIPAQLGRISTLTHLNLAGNELSGEEIRKCRLSLTATPFS